MTIIKNQRVMSSIPLSILTQKCPRCHTGNIFENNNMYKLSQLTKMHQSCPHCNENFRREPGFYFGAAFVSYALMVAADAFLGILIYLFIGNPLDLVSLTISSVVVLNIILMPMVYRYSRILFLYIFVKFDPSKK